MQVKLAALVALIWWAAYLVGDHEALELIAALGFTLAWFLLVMRRGHQDVESTIQKAVGDKGKRK